MYWWYLYIFCANPFCFIVFSSEGICSLQYVGYFSIYGSCWTYTRLQRLSQLFFSRKFIDTIIHLEKIFHRHICIHFGTRYEKSKETDGKPRCSPLTLRTNMGLSPVIMPQGIVIVHYPPLSVMFGNTFRILELV